ncbi:hypothetical protein GGS20DRAFT_552005 [Poronia punctata]|nr:hypothetical protein GGS20DRAFT_552005 [Poronia punctata]
MTLSTFFTQSDSNYFGPVAPSFRIICQPFKSACIRQILPAKAFIYVSLPAAVSVKMLEYFTIKKLKKRRDEKAADEAKNKKEQEAAEESPSPKIISKPDNREDEFVPDNGMPVLDHEDELFLERLTSGGMSIGDDEDETPPPLPPRVKTPVIDIDSDSSSVSSKKSKGKGKGKEKANEEKHKRFSFISRGISLKRKPVLATTTSGLEPSSTKNNNNNNNNHLSVPSTEEAVHEKTDLARVLDDLDLSAKNNRAFSLSAESAETVRRFTQVLKDLVNGVPTAYGDLTALLDDRDGILARNYEKLPKSLKKLVAQLPEKLTSSLAPELLAVAAEAQGEGGNGMRGAAKKFLTPSSLHDLVTKPGALVGLLKGIVNALKTRFPAFIGTNVLWSLAVFLLLSMLWYCYKRGREVRLEKEASETAAAGGEAIDLEGKPRVEELPDDPQLPGPGPGPGPSTQRDVSASSPGADVKVEK